MRSSHRSKTEDTKQSVRRLCWDNVLLSFSPTPFRFVFFSILSVCLSVHLFFSLRSAGLRPSGSVESNSVESSSVRYFVEFIRVNSHRVQPCRVQSSPQSHQVESSPVIQLSSQVTPVAQARDKKKGDQAQASPKCKSRQ